MKEPRYREIVDSYPANYGKLKGDALKVVEKYDTLRGCWDDLDEGKIRNQVARKKEIDDVSEISIRLANVVNGQSAKKVAEALYLGLCNKHRTLQAKAINSLIELLRLYKDSDYDHRNQAAVTAAAVISEVVKDEALYIPVI